MSVLGLCLEFVTLCRSFSSQRPYLFFLSINDVYTCNAFNRIRIFSTTEYIWLSRIFRSWISS